MEILERTSDVMVINMGPQHPSTHGVLRVELKTDGEVILEATPHLGYLHRDFEKHCEAVLWGGVIPYTDRMDYVAAMNNNFGYCLAVEKLLGTEIPERASVLRVLVSELNRIASHLLAFGTYGIDIGAFTPFLYAFREREMILDLFEHCCGARLTYNYIRIGGVSRDLPPEFEPKCRRLVRTMREAIPEYNNLLSYNQIFVARTRDIGVIPAELAIAWGCTGPVLRGSGVKWDLRKDEPYSIYPELQFEVPVGKGEVGTVGDCWDRYMVRLREMEQSVDLVEQCLDRLKPGPVMAKGTRSVKPPKGEVYHRTETPRGELGFYIVSDGGKKAYRCKVRSPCFCNLSILSEIAPGHLIADMVALIGSIDIVLGEVDR